LVQPSPHLLAAPRVPGAARHAVMRRRTGTHRTMCGPQLGGAPFRRASRCAASETRNSPLIPEPLRSTLAEFRGVP
jgi:hypothetical protein